MGDSSGPVRIRGRRARSTGVTVALRKNSGLRLAMVSMDANTARRCCDIAATAPRRVGGEHALDDLLVLAMHRREPSGVFQRQETHAVELRLGVLDGAPHARPARHGDQFLVHAVVERHEPGVVAACCGLGLGGELGAQFGGVGRRRGTCRKGHGPALDCLAQELDIRDRFDVDRRDRRCHLGLYGK